MGLQILINKEKKDGHKINWEIVPAIMLYSDIDGDSIKLYCLLGSQISKESIAQNKDSRVFPSFEKIREWTHWGNKKIGKHVNDLVKRGWIKNITNPQRYNFQSNYYLNVAPVVNTKLVNKREKRHKNMSISAKNRKKSK
jgi:hypothetical protein